MDRLRGQLGGYCSPGHSGEPCQANKDWVGGKGRVKNILVLKAIRPKRMKTERANRSQG